MMVNHVPSVCGWKATEVEPASPLASSSLASPLS